MFSLLIILFLCISILVYGQEIRLEADFAGVHFEKLTFFDNSTLFADITYVDRLITELGRSPGLTHPDSTLPPIAGNFTGDSAENFTVELLLIADFSTYQKFSEFYPNNSAATYAALHDYLIAIYEQMRTIYTRFVFFDRAHLSLRLVNVMPIIRPDDCPLRNAPTELNETNFDVEEAQSSNSTMNVADLGIDALSALHAIHFWLDENDQMLPAHDHIVVITSRDLLSQRNESSTQGMAYVRAMCRGSDSASVVEDVGGFATAAIAAHEMAHSLGAFHDGSGNSSRCAGRLNFLMAPTTSGNEQNDRFSNSVQLSPCSIGQIEEFLDSEDANCLRVPTAKEVERVPKIKLAKTFGRSQQCQIAFGPTYGVCTQRNPANRRRTTTDSCRRLWCKNRSEHRFNSCETKSYLPLMDGTACGPEKHCISGSCESNKSNKQTDCEDVRVAYCRKFSTAVARRFCTTKHIREICCKTCGFEHPNLDVYPQTKLSTNLKPERIKFDL